MFTPRLSAIVRRQLIQTENVGSEIGMRAYAILMCFMSCSVVDAQTQSGVVTYVPAVPLDKRSEVIATSDYSVVLDYRPSPGRAEIHEGRTQIFHILDGAGTLVTNGSVIAPQTIGPGEILGTAIESGRSYRLSKGDVIVVPAGTPHWFKEVESTLVYYTVNVTARSAP